MYVLTVPLISLEYFFIIIFSKLLPSEEEATEEGTEPRSYMEFCLLEEEH